MNINISFNLSRKRLFKVYVILPSLLMTNSALADLIAGTAESFDRFGSALVMGDYTNNGLMDLVVGVPGEDFGPGQNNHGAVNVFYSFNLTDNDHLIGDYMAFPDYEMGHTVASGDFNGDGVDDLAVGLPSAVLSGQQRAGAVSIYYSSGNNDGLLYSLPVWLWQGKTHKSLDAIKGVPEAQDEWGYSLATGLFNNDVYYDLAVGAPGEEIGGIDGAGAVSILYGSAEGLTTENNQIWHQDIDYVEGYAEPYDGFGMSLASGDFDGNGFDDLAIGVPYEDISSTNAIDGGAVNVLYSNSSGLAVYNDEVWHQESENIDGVAESDDHFGWALAAGDIENDGEADLVIGVPGENNSAGIINVIYGRSGGLSSIYDDDDSWDQDSWNIEGKSEAGDRFGESLAVGYFNVDSFADVAVGVPQESIGSTGKDGAVNIIYGGGAGLTATWNKVFTQNTTNIQESSEDADQFGYSLAAGDMDGDGLDELAIGVPGENSLGKASSGAMHVLTGNAAGLNAPYVFLYQD